METFNCLPLTNNSVTIGLSFLLLSISAIILSNTVNILRSLLGLYSFNIFVNVNHSIRIFNRSFRIIKTL